MSKSIGVILLIFAIYLGIEYVFNINSDKNISSGVRKITATHPVGKQLLSKKDKIIIFWSKYCKSCIPALEKIEKIANNCDKYEFIAISIKDKRSHNKIKYYSKEVPADSVLKYLTSYIEYKARGYYFIESVPFYVVIDKDGNITNYWEGKSNEFIEWLKNECD